MSRLPRKIPLLGAVAMAAVAAVTGCSAGQVTQTSTQVATVNGSSANVGQLALRDIRILYPSGGTYAEGSTAQLVLAVANQGLAEDTLIEVTGEFFDDAAVPTDDAGDEASVEVEVPAQGILQFGTTEFPSIELSDLSEEISVSEIVSLTFVFEQAGEVTVEVPVANPTREINREEGFDFHTEEGE
ncbi:MAG: copper chaperone PCu(A)C [Geodermatophilaceae bacterium]|nr:copper chaperone PCu(A)C [Geodermatophilaceae bacterium]